MLKLSDERILVGGTITLSAVWSYYDKNLGTRYITILKWSDYKDLKVGNEINVAGVLDKAVLIKALPEDGGSDSWTYTASDPGYYVVVAFVNSRTFDDSLAFLVESVAIGKPTVSISVDRGVVAWGDYVKVKASMSTDQPVTPVKVFITGAAVTTMICSYSGSGVYSVKDACNNEDEWWILIDSRRPEGTYVAKIDVGSGERRAEATATFQVVKPQVTSLTVPLQHVIGRDLVIEGVSNLAKSGSEADVGSPADLSKQNYAQLWIKDLSGNEVFNLSKQRTDANAISLIDDAGKFRFKIDNFGKSGSATGSLDRGFYVVEVKVYSGEVWSEVKTASFELVKATVKLSADKTTVTRGDDITFTITTNLKVNNEVKFTIEDTRFCVNEPGYDQCTNVKSYYTDVKGQIKIKLKVASEAPLTEYKFKAEETLTGVSDEIKIVVAKQALQLTAEKTTVARGGEIRFTGTTTVDYIYVYANEANVFKIGGQDVNELPSDTIITNPNTAMVPASDKKLDFKVEAKIDADTGSYYLYFFAPANLTKIDRSADTQAMVAVIVTDPRIISVDIPSKIPYQGKFEVGVLTDPGKRENVYLTFVMEGTNVKLRPGDFGLSDRSTPDANNYVNWTIDLKKYYENKGKTLEPGLYLFTVKMYFVHRIRSHPCHNGRSELQVNPEGNP
jgi:hypothetical protein